MKKKQPIDPTDTLRLHLSRAGSAGGRTMTEKKRAALLKNLIAAYRKRFPGKPIPIKYLPS
jgi:hypothetical protein